MSFEKGQRVFFNHPSESWIVGKIDRVEENAKLKDKTKYWCVPESSSAEVRMTSNLCSDFSILFNNNNNTLLARKRQCLLMIFLI